MVDRSDEGDRAGDDHYCSCRACETTGKMPSSAVVTHQEPVVARHIIGIALQVLVNGKQFLQERVLERALGMRSR
jgi:hypothetical protein